MTMRSRQFLLPALAITAFLRASEAQGTWQVVLIVAGIVFAVGSAVAWYQWAVARRRRVE